MDTSSSSSSSSLEYNSLVTVREVLFHQSSQQPILFFRQSLLTANHCGAIEMEVTNICIAVALHDDD